MRKEGDKIKWDKIGKKGERKKGRNWDRMMLGRKRGKMKINKRLLRWLDRQKPIGPDNISPHLSKKCVSLTSVFFTIVRESI